MLGNFLARKTKVSLWLITHSLLQNFPKSSWKSQKLHEICRNFFDETNLMLLMLLLASRANCDRACLSAKNCYERLHRCLLEVFFVYHVAGTMSFLCHKMSYKFHFWKDPQPMEFELMSLDIMRLHVNRNLNPTSFPRGAWAAPRSLGVCSS